MAEDQQTIPKLSERFSGLFGVEEAAMELSEDRSPKTIYIEESRKLNLNKLLHLAPYSEVLLLLGEPAVGRTSLLKAFIERAATTWRISFVTATAVMDGVAFLRQIGLGFEHSLDNVNSTTDLLWELDRYLQALGRSGRRAIIIIDDAHLLTDDVILLAEKILRDERTDNSVSLIVSMRKDQAAKLDRFALLKERLAYTLTLEPFSQKEVDGYLRHRMHETVPQLDEFLSPALVADIHRKSGGIPEKINALAHNALTKKDSVNLSGGDRGLLLKLMGLVLAAAAIGGVLYFQDEINQIFAVPAESARTTTDTPIRTDSRLASAVPDAADAQVLMAIRAAGRDAAAAKQKDSEAEQTAVMADAVEERLPAATEQPELMAEEVVVEAFAVEPKLGLDEVEGIKPVAEPVVETAEIVVETVSQVDTQAVTAAIAKVDTEGEEAPAPAPELEWLMRQPENYYTMQMMALVDKPTVLRFVQKHQIAEQSSTYPITRRGKVLTVLVYGSYASRAEANEAAKALPKSWGVGEPWIRRISDARSDLK
ncbi:MAG TPA: hypothetical protein ENJ65_06080 [Candidatus Tenderia electrophaga]|uniref:SPOR domain-containing protein n=1 Tax=Candidatus Tenderia electrophaga TaxID=1748243 RepID=A0A832J7M6_9GAMM|nr:hypothetical protein [Candidatus Tenderia electrophaga]